MKSAAADSSLGSTPYPGPGGHVNASANDLSQPAFQRGGGSPFHLLGGSAGQSSGYISRSFCLSSLVSRKKPSLRNGGSQHQGDPPHIRAAESLLWPNPTTCPNS